MGSRDFEERKAGRGERMIEMKVSFWTNDIASEEGSIVPKHCWDAGDIALSLNRLHGISGGYKAKFNSLMELPVKMEKLLLDCGIKLHHGRKSKEYYEKTS